MKVKSQRLRSMLRNIHTAIYNRQSELLFYTIMIIVHARLGHSDTRQLDAELFRSEGEKFSLIQSANSSNRVHSMINIRELSSIYVAAEQRLSTDIIDLTLHCLSCKLLESSYRSKQSTTARPTPRSATYHVRIWLKRYN